MAFQMIPDHGTVKGAPDNEVTLFYRDPLKAIQSLLDRSSLAGHMEFAPYRIYRQKDGGTDGSGSSQHTQSDDGQDKGLGNGSEEQSENQSRDGSDHELNDGLDVQLEIMPGDGSDYLSVEGSISEMETDSHGELDEDLEGEVEAYENPGYERRFTEMSTAAWWWRAQVIHA
jgi:hypothetical protein